MPKQPQLLSYTGPGSQQIDIKYTDFIKGMGTADTSNDGGFSPSTTEVNLIVKQGAFSAPAILTTISNLSGLGTPLTPVAGCDDPNLLGVPSGNKKYLLLVDSSAKGYFYNLSNTNVLSLSQSDSTTNRYAYASSDIVPFNGNVYATTNGISGSAAGAQDGDIVQWNGNATIDYAWWSSTKSKTKLTVGCPHPMLVFNKMLYIANKNVLASYDGTTATDAVLTLSSEQTITSLGVDPSTGTMLVGVVVTGSNFNNSRPSDSYIGLYNGTNPTQFNRKIYVDNQVNAFYNVGGTVFASYGKNIGIYSGTGIKFLYHLKAAGYNTADLVYKHRITNSANNLYFTDGSSVVCYGEILQDSQAVKEFYYAKAAPGNITFLSTIGSGLLSLYDTTSGNLASFDVNGAAVSTSIATFYSNSTFLPRKCWIRAVDVVLDAIPSGSNTHTISLKDDAGNTTSLGSIDSTATSTINRLFCSIQTTIVQAIDAIVGSAALVRLIIYYDLYE